jgi:hypothetical protein
MPDRRGSNDVSGATTTAGAIGLGDNTRTLRAIADFPAKGDVLAELQRRKMKAVEHILVSALNADAFNRALIRVAGGNITDHDTRASSWIPNATDVLFHACKHGFHHATPYQAKYLGGLLGLPALRGLAVPAQVEFESRR